MGLPEFPKVKKKLSDILSDSEDFLTKSKQIAVGMIIFAVGAFASSGEPTPPITKISETRIQGATESVPKLVLAQLSTSMHGLSQQHYSHYSHSSHYSHYSHQSHYSHYSSR